MFSAKARIRFRKKFAHFSFEIYENGPLKYCKRFAKQNLAEKPRDVVDKGKHRQRQDILW